MSCRGRCASREIAAAAGAARIDDRSINATSICTRTARSHQKPQIPEASHWGSWSSCKIGCRGCRSSDGATKSSRRKRCRISRRVRAPSSDSNCKCCAPRRRRGGGSFPPLADAEVVILHRSRSSLAAVAYELASSLRELEGVGVASRPTATAPTAKALQALKCVRTLTPADGMSGYDEALTSLFAQGDASRRKFWSTRRHSQLTRRPSARRRQKV